MKITIVAVGKGMPNWITEGFQEYQRRFPNSMPLELIEITNLKRGKTADVHKITKQEGEAMLKAVAKNSYIVTLDIPGKQYDTPQLAKRLSIWQTLGKDVYLLIGGPEGLSKECKNAANESWSISHLTLPHPLVRVVIAEALYRAWSLLNNHPYHRE